MWEKAEQGLQKMGGPLGEGWEDATLRGRDTPWYPGWGAGPPHATGWVGGRVIPELPGWGTAEHAITSAAGRLRVWSLCAEHAAA